MNTDEASPVKSNKSVERGGEGRVREHSSSSRPPALLCPGRCQLFPASGQCPARRWLRACQAALRDLLMEIQVGGGAGAGAQPLPLPQPPEPAPQGPIAIPGGSGQGAGVLGSGMSPRSAPLTIASGPQPP